MAWYYGVYSCGHEGRVNIIGPTKDREWKREKKFSSLCPERYKKARVEELAKKNAEAAKKSAEMELPELTGTKKQVAWANSLRVKFIEEFDEAFSYIKSKKITLWDAENNLVRVDVEDLHTSFDWALRSKTEARFWIDRRSNSVTRTAFEFVEEFKKIKDEIPEEIREEIAKDEEIRTVSAECSEKKPGVVAIALNPGSALQAKYIKDSDFIEIVKSLGYKWNGSVWEKIVTEYTGDSDNRAAELGNKLLLSGFTVQFPSLESKEKAVSGTYTEENDRWVKYNTKTGQLVLTWVKRSDALYKNAKKLPGARWKAGSMMVNIEFYREVEDFAETMGFSISEMAREEIEKYKRVESGYDTAAVTSLDIEKVSDEERIAKSLKSGGAIIEDLMDD